MNNYTERLQINVPSTNIQCHLFLQELFQYKFFAVIENLNIPQNGVVTFDSLSANAEC